jgi:DNA-binding NarL/FixJ family response regulator
MPYSNHRILILNSNQQLLNALEGLFYLAGIPVTGSSSSCKGLNDLLESSQADLLVTDVKGDDGSALPWLEKWLQKYPGLLITGYSDCINEEECQNLKLAGVKSCSSRKESPEKLLVAVKKLLGNPTDIQTDKETVLNALGGVRELEIFTLLGDGYKRNEIAATLQISPRTVDTYLSRIKANLGLASMHEVRRLAHDMAESFAQHR